MILGFGVSTMKRREFITRRARALIGGPARLPLREPFSLLDHRDHLDLNHCLWLSETADLDRRAGRTGYPEVAHAHVGALGECLVVRDEGVGLNNIGPSRASGLEAGVEVLKGLFELRPRVARADDVALCVACQLAGDVDGLTRACDRDDVRIGGLPCCMRTFIPAGWIRSIFMAITLPR